MSISLAATIRMDAIKYTRRVQRNNDLGCPLTMQEIAEEFEISPSTLYTGLAFLQIHTGIQAAIEQEGISVKLALTGPDCICYANLKQDGPTERQMLTHKQQSAIMDHLIAAYGGVEAAARTGIKDNIVTRAILAKIKAEMLSRTKYDLTDVEDYAGPLKTWLKVNKKRMVGHTKEAAEAACRAGIFKAIAGGDYEMAGKESATAAPTSPIVAPAQPAPAPTVASPTLRVSRLAALPRDLVASDIPGGKRFPYAASTSVDGLTETRLQMLTLELSAGLGYQPSRSELVRRILVWYTQEMATQQCEAATPPGKVAVHPVTAWLETVADAGVIDLMFHDNSNACIKLDRRQAVPGASLLSVYSQWRSERILKGDAFLAVPDTEFLPTLKSLLGNIQGPDDLYILPTATTIKAKLHPTDASVTKEPPPAPAVQLPPASPPEPRYELRLFPFKSTAGRIARLDLNRILDGRPSAVVFVGSKAQCQSEAATMSKLYHGLDYQINNVVEAK